MRVRSSLEAPQPPKSPVSPLQHRQATAGGQGTASGGDLHNKTCGLASTGFDDSLNRLFLLQIIKYHMFESGV